ncbi:MAG: hypothetical protein M3393_06320 [Actinomycetota bacterium]|nr:hypothetical protein [Actinomycetota bacterium]
MPEQPSPDARVFGGTVPFGIRKPLGELATEPGSGVSLWLRVDDLSKVVDAAGEAVVQKPFDSPFGPAATLRDPAGYTITVHEGAAEP